MRRGFGWTTIRAVALGLALALCACAPAGLAAAQGDVLAHWVFDDTDAKYVAGALDDNTMTILDQSGRGNDLVMMAHKVEPGKSAADYLAFGDLALVGADGAPLAGGTRSLAFSPMDGHGAYFVTAPGELDGEEFLDGYTIELVFSVDTQSTRDWQTILGKRGTPNSAYGIDSTWNSDDSANGDGSNQGSFNTGGSNGGAENVGHGATGDLQLCLHNTLVKDYLPSRQLNYQVTNWGDPCGYAKGRMHYAVIRNDGQYTTLYMDGIPALRSNGTDAAPGIDKLDGLGWALGANYGWDVGKGALTREQLLADESGNPESSLGVPGFWGSVQQIRMSKGYVPDSRLLIPDNRGLLPDDWYTSPQIGNDDPVSFLTKPGNYNLAIIPDTQYYVQYKGGLVLGAMLEWIRDHAQQHNIVLAMQVGDLTENSDARGDGEFCDVDAAFRVLDEAGTPYITVPGNHDNREYYLRTFPASRQQGKGYEFVTSQTQVGGVVAGGMSRYAIVRGGSYNYLVLAVGAPTTGQTLDLEGEAGKEAAWAQAVLDKYPTLPTILMNHHLDGAGIESIRDHNPQIFMQIKGHYTGSYAKWVTSGSNPGYWDLLIDYQGEAYGGNGWMDMLEFDEAANTITVRTFSPWVEKKRAEQAKDSQWWRSLPAQDRQMFPFDVKNLTMYQTGADCANTPPSNIKPEGRTDGVLALDFESRFQGLSRAQ